MCTKTDVTPLVDNSESSFSVAVIRFATSQGFGMDPGAVDALESTPIVLVDEVLDEALDFLNEEMTFRYPGHRVEVLGDKFFLVAECSEYH